MVHDPPYLETSRVVVRRFRGRDIPDILRYSAHDESDEHRRRNIDWEPTAAGVRAWWTPMAKMQVDEATEWLGLVIEAKELGCVVGNTGFKTETLGEHRQGMVGWIIGKDFEGRGYVLEAATALLDYLFRIERFRRVYAMTSAENERSWRLMERLGMRREAHFIRNSHHDAGWCDEYVYAILAEEWTVPQPDAGGDDGS